MTGAVRGHALTVDVEEWYQTVLFEPGNTDPGLRTSLPRDVERILSILEARRTRATFFVLGCVAEKYPGLVESLSARGHEVASHGYSHRRVCGLTPAEFGSELRRSREVLSERAGARVAGYRASTWSISDDSGWAVRELIREGFTYDSSLYPWGRREDRTSPRRLDCGLWELPPSTARCLGWNVPFAGGTFLRFQTRTSLLERVARLDASGRPALTYFHSWEFCEAPPGGLPAWKRALQFGNARGVAGKLEALLGRFSFAPIREVWPEAAAG